MSSRTSSGKKKVKRMLPESKLVPIKPQVIKVEIKPSPPQVIELKSEKEETKRNIVDWDVIGFSSAAITLFGAAVLFMLGWAYEVNWYGYFGVSMTQVATQPQNIFIQSIPGLITLITMLLISIITFVGFETIKKKISQETIDKEEIFIGIDWVNVLLFSVSFMLIYLLNYVFGARGKVNDIFLIYEIYYLLFLIVIVATILVGLFFIYFAESIGLILKFGFTKWKASVTNRKLSVKYPQGTFISIAFAFILVFESIAVSAVYAINDAAQGLRGSGRWRIQPMSLVTSRKYYFSESIEQTCQGFNCISGPFGLIGENDNNYILIKWKEDNDQYFIYHPGLFVIPKSEMTYLIPFTASPIPQAPPTPTANLDIPAITSTITPTLRPTITLTVTATPLASQP